VPVRTAPGTFSTAANNLRHFCVAVRDSTLDPGFPLREACGLEGS
jgi:hypothetical protein